MTKTLLQRLRRRWILFLASLTPPCRRIVELGSRRLDAPAGVVARLQVRIHLGICTACRRYLEQIALVHEAARRSRERPTPSQDAAPRPGLPAGARERIRERIRCERSRS
jgi:predicted anti-sigma-YlaC factor YlaD